MGPSTAQAGGERLDDCFERCEQIATPSGLLASEFGFDCREAAGQYIQVDAGVKPGVRKWAPCFVCGRSARVTVRQVLESA